MATEVEKTVEHAEIHPIQDAAENAHDHLFGKGPRCNGNPGRRSISLRGRRQGLAIEFAIGSAWQRLEHDEVRRDHIFRQSGPDECAQWVGQAGHGVPGDEIGHKASVSRVVLARDDRNLADRRVPRNDGFDFTRFDAKAAQLDLAVKAAEMFERAVIAPAGAIASAVKAVFRSRTERVRDESLRRQIGPIPVTESDSDAPDAQLAVNTDGAQIFVRIEDPDDGVGDRLADGDAVGGVGNAGAGGPHRGLGGSVHVPQLDTAGDQLIGKVLRHGFAADQRFERGPRAPACLQQQAPGDRSGLHHGGATPFEEGGEGGAINGFIVGRYNDRSAECKREVELEHGDIEGQGGDGRQHIVNGKAGLASHAGEEIDDRAVWNNDTLGLAG